MNQAVTIITKAGIPSVLIGPEVPFSVQRKDFSKNRHAAEVDGAEKIELWTSLSGRVRRKKLNTTPAKAVPPVSPAPTSSGTLAASPTSVSHLAPAKPAPAPAPAAKAQAKSSRK